MFGQRFFQPHAALLDSVIGQSSLSAEVNRKVLDELWRQFQHRHVRAAVMRLDALGSAASLVEELGHVLS